MFGVEVEGLYGVVAGLVDDCGPVRALVADVFLVAVAGVELARGCGPFRGLEDELGAVEKNFSDVSTMGENLIFLVLL